MTTSRPVALVITNPKPKLRYAASQSARQLSPLRKFTPARTFDKQLRKFNRLAG